MIAPDKNTIHSTPQKISAASCAGLLLAIMPFVVVFVLTLTHPLDPDLGWHLKYGEHFVNQHTVLQENTFSAEMPGYRYVNHSWGSDVLLYAVYNAFGFLGVSLLGAIVMTMTFFFFARAAKLSFWEEAILFPPMLYLLDGIIAQSYRSQSLSLLGLGGLFFLVERFEDRKRKALLFLIPLFALWANMHGQFIVGLALLGLWGAAYSFRTWLAARNHQALLAGGDLRLVLAVVVGAFCATLITPYGVEIYLEISRHVGNNLQQYIKEWQPIANDPELLWQLIGWGVFLAGNAVMMYRQRLLLAKAHYLLPSLLFFIASFAQLRYYWPLILISMPIAATCLTRIRPASNKATAWIAVSLLASAYLYGSLVKLPSQQIISYDWNRYCRHLGCTSRSADFLQTQLAGASLLTDYDLGGWLIWNYPGIKPTIDGRMPFWRDEQGYSAYEKYVALESGEADIDRSAYNMVYWPPKKEALFNRLNQLVDEGKWRVLYVDPFAYIFARNQQRSSSHPVTFRSTPQDGY